MPARRPTLPAGHRSVNRHVGPFGRGARPFRAPGSEAGPQVDGRPDGPYAGATAGAPRAAADRAASRRESVLQERASGMATIGHELERLERAIDLLEQALVDRDQRWHAALEKAKRGAEAQRARTEGVASRVDLVVERLEAVLERAD